MISNLKYCHHYFPRQCMGHGSNLLQPINRNHGEGSSLDRAIFLGLRCFCPTLHAFPGRCLNGWFFWGGPGGVKRRRLCVFFFFSGHVSHGQSLLVCIFWGEQLQEHPHGFVSLSIEVFIPINLRISRDLHIILNTSHSSNTTLGLEVCFCLPGPSPMFDPSDTTTTYFIW